MYKFTLLAIFLLSLTSFKLYASSEEDGETLSTNTYKIRIMYDCKLNESECSTVKFVVYNKVTKETVQVYGKSELSQTLLEDGTLSSGRISGYKFILGAENWNISIPSGTLIKKDKNGTEIYSEVGEWVY